MGLQKTIETDLPADGELAEDRLADFTRDRRIIILSLMALVIGTIGAFVAWALVWLIAVITNLSFYKTFSSAFVSPANNHLGLLVIVVPVIGGLIIGLMARYGSEKIRGHGIPEALEAILVGQSRMEPKVALLKPLSSAISIGTGGPFGAEGPIIMTGGAFGSLFAQLFHLSQAERKTLLVAGAAAGMSAIFASPLAATLLAVELLLFEWKPRSFIPVAIASIVASAWRVPLLGAGPIFPVSPHAALNTEGLAIACAVGLVGGIGSAILTTMVYGFEDLFMKLPIHWMWWPIIGGLFVGIGGYVDPRVLGVGYDTIHLLISGQLLGAAAVGLLIGKALVWSIALGSGTSGGVLAPLLIMGGALGAIEAQWIPTGDPGLWAMISMAAIMGGTMRSPLTGIVFTLELTHDLNVLPALLVACIAAHAFTVLVLRRSILTEKVARHGHHIAREYSVDPLEVYFVSDFMDRDATTVPATMTLAELSERLARNEPAYMKHHAFPILDAHGKLAGIITRRDLLKGLEKPGLTVLEAGTQNPVLTYPDETVREATTKMLTSNVGRLLVVDRKSAGNYLGYLGRPGILEARLRRLHEEHVRERGWTPSVLPRRRKTAHHAHRPSRQR